MVNKLIEIVDVNSCLWVWNGNGVDIYVWLSLNPNISKQVEVENYSAAASEADKLGLSKLADSIESLTVKDWGESLNMLLNCIDSKINKVLKVRFYD